MLTDSDYSARTGMKLLDRLESVYFELCSFFSLRGCSSRDPNLCLKRWACGEQIA
jgi:hypothetical protein